MFLYKSAVTKHGSHNQQSHAGSRGGGGGGSGTSATTTSEKPKADSPSSKMRISMNALNRAKKEAGQDPDRIKEVKNLSNALREAQKAGAKGLPDLAKRERAARRALKEGVQFGGLDGVDYERYMHDAIVYMGQALGGTKGFSFINDKKLEQYMNSNSVGDFGAWRT